MKAWHFLKEGSVLRDGTIAPADGVSLVVSGPIKLCNWGLHASLHPFDALCCAPGPVLCLVDCAGTVVQGADKLVCTQRTILARMDATPLLNFYARMQALKATQYWDPPQVVLDYLMTGDASIRAAARAAAWAAARAAAWAAADAADAAARAAADAAREEFQALVAECFSDYL